MRIWKHTKFWPSSINGIFVGYIETCKVWYIYIPVQWNIVVSRDVKFDKGWQSSRLKESPIRRDGSKEIFVSYLDLKLKEKPDSDLSYSSK